MQKKPTVGIIGLGIIGSRVAANLRRAGFPVVVWNRTPRSEPNFLASPAEVAEVADIIQIFVQDGKALLEVLQNLSPALTARHVVLNHATVHPQQTLEAASIVERRGAQFLDAPFTGSRDAAAEGKLVYFVGGFADILGQVRPVLEISSKETVAVGPVGAATTVKIANNILIAAQVASLAEALELLKFEGVPLDKLGETLQHSAANSSTLAMKLPQMLGADYEPRFSTKNMLKDLQFGLEIAHAQGTEFPATAAAAAALRRTAESGLGDADFAAVASHYSFPGMEQNLFSLKPPAHLAAEEKSHKSKNGLAGLWSFFRKR
ncbi:MAG: NAD(P)-dependent oxidoreductase [Verrucomicrobia bacterium]|nr:NAD(P)-dependent oxidoreductase [Verrucomicrobiota bacterium]